MSDSLLDLRNESIIVWEQLTTVIQRMLLYNNVARYNRVRVGNRFRNDPVYKEPSIAYGGTLHTKKWETQCE